MRERGRAPSLRSREEFSKVEGPSPSDGQLREIVAFYGPDGPALSPAPLSEMMY